MNIKGFFTKKRIIWGIVIVVILGLVGLRVFKPKTNSSTLTDVVKKQDLKQTVLATGQVVSGTDLSLGFQGSGIVTKVEVKEGGTVKAGQELATLDQKNPAASLTTARGALAQAQANYQKVLAGASNEDIAVTQEAVNAAQVALDNAKTGLSNTIAQQNVAVTNAYNSLINSTLSAVPGTTNLGAGTAMVSGTYTGKEQGQYAVTLYSTGSGLKFKVSGLETAEGDVKPVPVSFGSKGLFLQFSGNPQPNDYWTITIPNTQAANYVLNYNNYQAALQAQSGAVANAQAAVSSAQVALSQAQAALDLKKSQARPADIAAAEASILSAQGQVQAASASFENTVLRAPADGVITKVSAKVGQQATAMQEAMVLQDISNLHVEANISEANVAGLKAGQSVDLTFDALGPDRHFQGTIQTINPASTVVSGVVNYKVTVSLSKVEEIKPGMTSNMVILTGQKSAALSVPSRAIISQDGKKLVRVVDDPVKKTYHQVEVTTGMEADGGLTEIVSGLSDGQVVVTYIK